MLKLQINRKKGGLKQSARNLPQAAKDGVEKAAKDTMAVVISKASGKVKKVIRMELVNMPSGKVLAARVFNDTQEAPWSSYTEFGTGKYVDNEGVPEAIRLKRAKSIPWYIHVSQVPPSFERYGYPLVTGWNGEQYWQVVGTHPHPYMMPAAFQNRPNNIRTVASAVADMLREVGISST